MPLTLYKDIGMKHLDDALENGLTPHERTAKHDKRLSKILERNKLPTRDEVIYAYIYQNSSWAEKMMWKSRGILTATLIIKDVPIEKCYVADAMLVNEACVYSSGERDYWYVDSFKKFTEVFSENEQPNGYRTWGYRGRYRYPEILINMDHIHPENIVHYESEVSKFFEANFGGGRK